VQHKLAMTGRLVVGALAMAGMLLATQAGAGALDSHATPSIKSFSVSPDSMSWKGGVVTLTVKVADARHCHFSADATFRGLPVNVNCESGTATKKVGIPANTNTVPVTYTFEAQATLGSDTVSKKATVTVKARSGIPTIFSGSAAHR
jgi:hypothetical protein